MEKELSHQLFIQPVSRYADDDARWAAVQNKDALADGTFVYAVKTTKIYCRPICKARLPRRANVAFYTEGTEAQAKGFRACKRCKPDIDGSMPEELAVRKIRAFISDKAHTGGLLSLSQMAKQTGLSKWHFHRVFKKCAGMTPSEFLRGQQRDNGACGNTHLTSPPLTDDSSGMTTPLDWDSFSFDWPLDNIDQNWLNDFVSWPDDDTTTGGAVASLVHAQPA